MVQERSAEIFSVFKRDATNQANLPKLSFVDTYAHQAKIIAFPRCYSLPTFLWLSVFAPIILQGGDLHTVT